MSDFWNPFNDKRNADPTEDPLGRYVERDVELANEGGQKIGFTHVPTNNTVYFKAYITAYNETFNSDWASEVVYGRADPIYLFKNTTRKITLAFKVPATTASDAYDNLGKVQLLTQFLYPTYIETGQAQTITQSPLIRLKLMNLATNTAGASGEQFDGYTTGGAGDDGLLGVVGNLTINHNLDTDVGVVAYDGGVILPKLIEINLDFSPIHEHALGWNDENKFGVGYNGVQDGPSFPYGVGATVPEGGAGTGGSNSAPAPTKTNVKNAAEAMPADDDTLNADGDDGATATEKTENATTPPPESTAEEAANQNADIQNKVANSKAANGAGMGSDRYEAFEPSVRIFEEADELEDRYAEIPVEDLNAALREL